MDLEKTIASVEAHPSFYVEKDWKTESGIPEAMLSEGKSPATYRHIKSGNTTYGTIDRQGGVALTVRFVDQSMTPRDEVIPSILDRYGDLVRHLGGIQGLNFETDPKMDKAIQTAESAI